MYPGPLKELLRLAAQQLKELRHNNDYDYDDDDDDADDEDLAWCNNNATKAPISFDMTKAKKKISCSQWRLTGCSFT